MAPPARIELTDAVLRPFAVADAEALARAVRESLEHLSPWMPWADANSAQVEFQRQRLQGVVDQFARGEEYQYGLFDLDETRVLGSFGLMTRHGRGTLEIGYWVHVDAIGHGHTTRATAALTDVAFELAGVKHVLIYTDVANLRSAASAAQARIRAAAHRGRAACGVERDRPPAGVATHHADRPARAAVSVAARRGRSFNRWMPGAASDAAQATYLDLLGELLDRRRVAGREAVPGDVRARRPPPRAPARRAARGRGRSSSRDPAVIESPAPR